MRSGKNPLIKRIFGQLHASSALVAHKCDQSRESRREMDGTTVGTNGARKVAIQFHLGQGAFEIGRWRGAIRASHSLQPISA
jgi:hypothetical protein